MIIVFALVLVETSMLYFSLVSSNKNKDNYKKIATNLSQTVAEVVDVQAYLRLQYKVNKIVEASPTHPVVGYCTEKEYDEYIAQFAHLENDEDFLDIRDFLRTMVDANTDEKSKEIDCIYLSYIDAERELFIYVVDSAPEEDACPPGCINELLPINKKIISDPERGFPAYTTNTQEYGHLVTAGSPIHNKQGEVVGYAMVDVSMTLVRRSQADSIMRLFVYLIITVILLCVVGLIVIHFVLIKPINTLIQATKAYDINEPDKTHESFAKLNVKTKDELFTLAESMKKMENDINNKIREITEVNQELISSQQTVEKMTELANKDGLTGVRNKVAYNNEVERIDELIQKGKCYQFGIAMVDLNYLKVINDKYGHNDGDSALIKLCNILCTIFAHSPVFRIGGDEFVIILRNVDYKNANVLINEFNDKIDELNEDEYLLPSEKVSAAIGFASFDAKKDKSVSDVFSRADKAMYIRKNKMKEKD